MGGTTMFDAKNRACPAREICQQLHVILWYSLWMSDCFFFKLYLGEKKNVFLIKWNDDDYIPFALDQNAALDY